MSQHHSFYLYGTLTIFREGDVFLGNAQIRLLKQVLKDGSIHAAAKNLKMSYQHAWHLLDKVNQLSPLPILIRQKGGRDGGGCLISSVCKKTHNYHIINYLVKDERLKKKMKKH